ncbi:MAG: hypothetical protein JO244_06620, partial [Solirubrobacterales bacterium]|nr:hypothetical protein [Solirubrobacterales bacterium]
MRGRLSGLLLVAALTFPGAAAAAPVLVMGRGGRVHRANDRFLTAGVPTPGPSAPARRPTRPRPPGAVAARAKPPKRPKPKPPSVSSELIRLYASGQISASADASYSASWAAALAAAQHLHGTRATELGAVMANLQTMAAAHDFVPSRLPALFLTLDRNRQWWTTG